MNAKQHQPVSSLLRSIEVITDYQPVIPTVVVEAEVRLFSFYSLL